MSEKETYLIGVEVRKSVFTDVIVKVAAESKEDAIKKARLAGCAFINDQANQSVLEVIEGCNWAETEYSPTGRTFPNSYTNPPYTDEDVMLDLTKKATEEE